MREIKFSYMWSDGHNWINNIHTLDAIEGGDQYDAMSDNALLKHYRLKARRQYTGLKDKNGTEIYEGDVVKHPYRFGQGFGQVAYWPPMFKLQADNGTCDEIMMSECEVIGNIYENKDLLDAQRA